MAQDGDRHQAAGGTDGRHAADLVHIAGTTTTMARLYVNGQLVDSQALTGRFAADTTPFILGANGNGVGDANVSERFPGRIDEIMLYRRALSADEIGSSTPARCSRRAPSRMGACVTDC